MTPKMTCGGSIGEAVRSAVLMLVNVVGEPRGEQNRCAVGRCTDLASCHIASARLWQQVQLGR